MRPALKVMFVALIVIGAIGGLIGGAWYLENYSKRIKTVVVERPGGDLFVIESEERKGSTVFIQCDEDEFEDAFKAFRRFLDVEGPPLTIPGGPMLIARAPTEVPNELKPAQRATIEILKRHAPTRIILLAHSDCLLYDTVAAWHNELGRVKEKQFEDLRRAVAALKLWLPNTKVEVYYALRDGKRLRFNPVDIMEHRRPMEGGPVEIKPQQ